MVGEKANLFSPSRLITLQSFISSQHINRYIYNLNISFGGWDSSNFGSTYDQITEPNRKFVWEHLGASVTHCDPYVEHTKYIKSDMLNI